MSPSYDRRVIGHEEASPISQMAWSNKLFLLLLAIPSLSVMVFLRRKIGYRTLPSWIGMLLALALYGFSYAEHFAGLFAFRVLMGLAAAPMIAGSLKILMDIAGEARFADELERVLYNGVLSGVALKGDAYF